VIHLFGGDRVLRLRFFGAAAVAPFHEIPFLDLPDLGGRQLLRGYRSDRFRDRIAMVGSIEYRFPIQPTVAGFVFTDAGRVFHDLDELTVDRPRVGYGGGLLWFTSEVFLFRVVLASSIDGGLEFFLSFDTNDVSTIPR
jgi:outer membrane protein assembly factor BamA